MFREAVLAFMGVNDKDKEQKSIEDKYCSMCRFAGKNDCENCSKEFRIVNN